MNTTRPTTTVELTDDELRTIYIALTYHASDLAEDGRTLEGMGASADKIARNKRRHWDCRDLRNRMLDLYRGLLPRAT